MEPNETPAPAPVTPAAPEPKTSYGALIALVLIVLAIAGAAMYFLKMRIADSAITADPSVLTEQSDSTEPEAIENDLSAESPDEFDQDLEQAFVELDTAFDAE